MKKILKHFLNQRGISLIEILIGSLISLIIAAAAMAELTRQVRSAGYGMTIPPYYSISGDTLTVFRKPGADVDTIRFYISRSDTLHPNLLKKVDTQAAQLFAENITQITFTQLGTGALQVTFTAREARKDEDYAFIKGYRTRQLTTRIKLRNV